MRTKTALLTFLSFLLVSISVSVLAQQGPPPRELMLPKRIFFALRQPTTDEIQLSAAGKQKILDAFEGTLEVDGDMIRLSLNGSQDPVEMEQSALGTLTADQRKKLEELWIRRFGGLTLLDPKVAKTVGVTDEQSKQIDELAEKGGKELEGLMSGGPDPESRKKIESVRTDYGKRMAVLLTAKQAKTFEGLKGKL